tara:strand:- start:21836 stop:21952 length:117 start_codon:yes stop_codon:yes gene_type:complete
VTKDRIEKIKKVNLDIETSAHIKRIVKELCSKIRRLNV